MSSIFVVGGSSGCYSDRSEWNVRAFKTREEAEEFKGVLKEAVERHASAVRDRDGGCYEREEEFKKMAHLDPEAQNTWDDIEYNVGEVPFGKVRK